VRRRCYPFGTQQLGPAEAEIAAAFGDFLRLVGPVQHGWPPTLVRPVQPVNRAAILHTLEVLDPPFADRLRAQWFPGDGDPLD
jgi:hypothetical protein